MTLPPRHIVQPGLPHPDRIVAVEARGESFSFDLAPGAALLEGVRRGFADKGYVSGVVELRDMLLGPFAYVTPALSKTGENAAFYSDIFRPAGITRVSHGALTFGARDSAPFFHCHGLWSEADGKHSGGHMLPEATFLAAKATVTALGLSGAAFVAEQDAEINFKVFGPKTAGAAGHGHARAIALRPRPNQDFHAAIASVCARHGIRRARLRGGVGSTIGCVFEDGRVIGNFATEVYIEHGSVEDGRVEIDVGAIDYTDQMARGRLRRGDNPVLMTFELVVEEV